MIDCLLIGLSAALFLFAKSLMDASFRDKYTDLMLVAFAIAVISAAGGFYIFFGMQVGA